MTSTEPLSGAAYGPTPEDEERTRLGGTLTAIDQNLAAITSRLRIYAKDVQDAKTHMWEARRDMDHIDKVAMRQSIEQRVRSAEVLKAQHDKLIKMRDRPYFGRVDFKRAQPGMVAEPIYIGIHDFRDEESGTIFAHDWRAPVASIFYDYETGAARFEAPKGIVEGEITLKRQFRIEDGQLVFMFETGLQIVDDVLQQELSRAADDGMKNIVATIQRDQNAIIRDGEKHTLIIQGVAGSGKTSIALHRIAFLLYRFKDTLSSRDILIISPNRVFADYIGNVLPELGEEQVNEIGMGGLADALLKGKVRYRSFFEQTAELIESDDPALRERIGVKSSLDLLKKIDAYVEFVEEQSIEAAQWQRGRMIVPDWFFREAWQKNKGLGHSARISRVVEEAEHQIVKFYNHQLRTDERQDLRASVRAMTKRTTVREIYKAFYEWLGRSDLFKPAGGKLEYNDVFPLIYLKMRIEGIDNPFEDVKHLIVDEMQDYSPVQYAVLARLFTCRKTILGDATQALNPIGASTGEQIQQVLRASAPVTLNKSYRSTWEIMQLALAISPNDDLVPMKRHGDPPTIAMATSAKGVLEMIIGEIRSFEESEHETLAVIAKSQKTAAQIHKKLQQAGVDCRLLDLSSTGFSRGVSICTAHLAKGLEFDRVIVPDADGSTYGTDLDRNLLYVACTRAMHRLTLTGVGRPSPLVPDAGDSRGKA